ncbi:hypothetical protein HWV62_35316 [Athelia sp. TMB]|nr:hypothetical protein HWV62_35316 [Athelia sp. TMB]
MADAGFFKGTSSEQDRRFSDKEVKLLKSMKFPPEFDKKVDMRKVNLEVIRPWIAKKVVELVGFEDEVVVEYAMGLLEDKQEPNIDPKKMQINLTGFLTKDTPSFMVALWSLLLEAQESPAGVPRTFVEQKKEEMRKAREGDTRALDERDRRAGIEVEAEMEVSEEAEVVAEAAVDLVMTEVDLAEAEEADLVEAEDALEMEVGAPEVAVRDPSPVVPSAAHPPLTADAPRPVLARLPADTVRHPDAHALALHLINHVALVRRHSPLARVLAPALVPQDLAHHLLPRATLAAVHAQRRSRRLLGTVVVPPEEKEDEIAAAPLFASGVCPLAPRVVQVSPALAMETGNGDGVTRSPRRRSVSRDKRNGKGRRQSRSISRSPDRDIKMNDDDEGGELKIKGQAEAQKKKGKWEDDSGKEDKGSSSRQDPELAQRENELKEKALRNKVVRTRKGSNGA